MKRILFFNLVFLSAQFAKAQNVGIGTTTPYAKLHVVDGLSGMNSTMGTMAIESAAAENLLQFKSIETAKAGILFGGGLNSTRASIVFNHPSNYGGMNISVNAGAGVFLSSLGNVGVGIVVPEAKLHVAKGIAAATTAHPNAIALLENSDHGYLQFLNPATKEGGIMFGNPNGVSQGGIYYNNPGNPEGLDFRTNGNNVRLTIDNAGNTGIGTGDPTAKLDVNGSIRVRSNNPVAGAVMRSADNLGNINWMKPTAFKASGLVGQATQTIPANTWTKVLFGATEYNEGFNYQQAASFLVAPVAGIYHFDVQLKQQYEWGHYMRIEAKRGNSIIVLAQEYSFLSTISISTDVKLMAGDEISVSFLQQYLDVNLFSHPDEVFFNGHLITQL
jgi:hypothetical protein